MIVTVHHQPTVNSLRPAYGARMVAPTFRDRADAGRRLSVLLRENSRDCVVLGLARGGVPVAAEVARALRCDMDVLVVRKLGVPGQPELAMGALCEEGVRVVSDSVVRMSGVTPHQLADTELRQRRILDERVRAYRQGRPPMDVEGRTVIIVDDGIATGATARAACTWARRHGAQRIVLAVPVGPAGWEDGFGGLADECVSVSAPGNFQSVGSWYVDFSEVSDGEVLRSLTAVNREPVESSTLVHVGAGVNLRVDVTVPPRARGCVVFVHGSGSSRLSPRNRRVASVLNDGSLVTVLFDLLTEDEAGDRDNVFDTAMLADRLLAVVAWVQRQQWSRGLRTGLFGASTGAAAALIAAASEPATVSAVVSRGGRPDLAAPHLRDVLCPVLLLVGSEDRAVLQLNRTAEQQLGGTRMLVKVAGATHLFEEPGTLDLVAQRAREFFLRYLDVPAVVAAG